MKTLIIILLCAAFAFAQLNAENGLYSDGKSIGISGTAHQSLQVGGDFFSHSFNFYDWDNFSISGNDLSFSAVNNLSLSGSIEITGNVKFTNMPSSNYVPYFLGVEEDLDGTFRLVKVENPCGY
jgi:hypothetical protein